MREKFIAGNWKMYKNRTEAVAFAREFRKLYEYSGVRAAICAPYLHLESLKGIFDGTEIKVGAQNMHFEDEGAYTGEIAPGMLEELGIDYCIIGHSERRQYFGETDETVNRKLAKCFSTSMLPILCVGEALEERDAGKAFQVVERQVTAALEGISAEKAGMLTIAYEPVWAIGTGRTATPEQADEMCGFIRKISEKLYGEQTGEKIVIQYGGSVKPGNAADIMNMPQIDGALVGGASLKPADFMKILRYVQER